MKTLSSPLTFFYKYIFTLGWIGMIIPVFLSNSSIDEQNYQFLSFWILGSLFVYFICGRLKKVQVDGRNVAMLIVKKRSQVPPGIYICERWKAQTRLLFVV